MKNTTAGLMRSMPLFFQGGLMIDTSCLSEGNKDFLKSPSPWFHTNRKTQRKLIQMFKGDEKLRNIRCMT